ncbi:hypothetical protein R69746_08233 [Paraburkholderia aspalathi]|uniref:hypothetical protein n=1 Tax=Paraburkholderia aspalathi TaxID=1324617 RepID=UPI00190C54B4|nr:hypothetical protein [Paraburkholderia aspalathi]MBK3844150.1 hypothetical protein [Paraburkholderia aspalathi]CAE6868123.1 hypothetical protein R69746_08233 [Paraburkholderia aspalathi]
MREAKRRTQAAAASITTELREMAARIDAQMLYLEAAGVDETEIVAAMVDHMSAFHHLMQSLDNPAINFLGQEFTGFYRYAKIVETIASGIATGPIQVPGQERKFAEEHRIAAAIDQRVRQLEAKGIRGRALLEPMAGYTPDLHRLWNAASDELLVALCRAYPGLYRYGDIFEQAWLAGEGRMTPAPPALPDSVKPAVLRLLSDGATLERELQAILDARPQRDLWVQAELLEETYRQWSALLAQLPELVQAADVPEVSRAMMREILEPMTQRIETLRAQVYGQ